MPRPPRAACCLVLRPTSPQRGLSRASVPRELTPADHGVRPARADQRVDGAGSLRLPERGPDCVEVRDPDEAPVQGPEAEDGPGGAVDAVQLLGNTVLPAHGFSLPRAELIGYERSPPGPRGFLAVVSQFSVSAEPHDRQARTLLSPCGHEHVVI